jgi:hypothetical protein
MNRFYYLDQSAFEVFFYEIETDMTYEQLCQYINKKALEHCKKLHVDPEMYMNGEVEEEIVLEIKIKNKIFNFNLYSALHHIKDVLKTNKFSPKRITVLLEELI